MGDASELVVETEVGVELLLADICDWEIQRSWPIERSQFASSVGLNA